MRNKLIKLIEKAKEGYLKTVFPLNLEQLCDMPPSEEYIADHLIANGVTLKQWIPVSERLPDTMNDVLCWYEYFRFGEYQRMFQTYGVGFCVSGMWGGEAANGYMSRVLYWMPLPEPPKGDKL